MDCRLGSVVVHVDCGHGYGFTLRRDEFADANTAPFGAMRAVRPLLSRRVPLARAATSALSARFIYAPVSLRSAPLLSARRLAPPLSAAPPLLAARRLLCTAGSELVTTRSGLMYRDVSVPEGARAPNTGDTVRVHYTGRLEVSRA
jgi:hypothetical protein